MAGEQGQYLFGVEAGVIASAIGADGVKVSLYA